MNDKIFAHVLKGMTDDDSESYINHNLLYR